MKRLNLLYLAGVLVIAIGFFASPAPGWAAVYGDHLSDITTGGLNQPAKVAVDSANGDVYVTDAGNKMVKKYDKNSNYISSFNLTVSGTPVGIAVNSTNIFVGDDTNHCVWIYNKTGALTDLLGTGTSHKLGGLFGAKLMMPNTITVGPSGHIFVVTGDSDQVSIFRTDGTLYSTFGISGSGTSSGTTINVYYPSGLAMAESTVSGNSITQYFYLGDQGNFRVQKLYYVYDKYSKDIVTVPTYNAASGSLTIPAIAGKGDAFGKFLRVSDLVYDSNRSMLYVVDSLQSVVQQFNGSGVTQGTAFNYASGATQTFLNVPTGGAINLLTQTLYVTNNQGNSISEFSTTYGTQPTLAINSPATANIPITSNPYAVNYTYTAGASATLYLFYDTDNTWSGGSKSITPGTGEYAIGTVSIASGGATADYSWQIIRANPGTYYVRGIVVDANGNSAESYSLGTVVVPTTPGGLNALFFGAHPGMTDNPNADDDQDGLTNGQEQTWGTDPLNPDTDGGGVSDGIEVAKGGNPLDSSDDMNLAVDKYGVWFADGTGNWTTYYVIKNTGDNQDIVNVTFDEWRGVGSRINTVKLVIPARSYVRFIPRSYTAIQYGSMYVRSLNSTEVGYMDMTRFATDASQLEAICYLQDSSDATNQYLYVPFINDGTGAGQAGNTTALCLKNLDPANTSNGSRTFTTWPDPTVGVQTWAENLPPAMTDTFRPSWMTSPTYTQSFSAASIPRTNTCKTMGQVMVYYATTQDRGTYAMPTQPKTTFYLPFFKDMVDDSLAYDAADTHWRTAFAVMNTTNAQATGTVTIYNTTGTVVATAPVTNNAGATTILRPKQLTTAIHTGWLRFDFNSPGQGVGYQLLQYLWGNGTSDAATFDDRVSGRLTLSRYIDNASGYSTYVSLLNTSSSPVAVTATYRDSSGNVLGTPATISIGALSCVYFRPTDYNAATEGSIEFTCPIPSLVGVWQQVRDEEPFTDQNANNKWDPGEPYVDTYGAGAYTPRQSGMDNLLSY